MKQSFWLLIGLLLVACTTGESTATPVAQAVTTTPALTATLPETTTPTVEPMPTIITPTLTLAATISPTHTPEPTSTVIPIFPPTGRIYFLWDPTEPVDGYPNQVQNLYMATPGQTPDDWKIKTILTGLAGLPVLALSPDRTKLALTVYEDVNNDGYIVSNGAVEDAPNVFVYSFGTQMLERLTDNFPLAWDLTWSSDNERLAYKNGKDVYIATYPSLGEVGPLYAFPNYVQELAWSPDGKYLAIGVYENGIYLFDNEAILLTKLNITQQVWNLVWSFDSQWLASNQQGPRGLFLIHIPTQETISLVQYPVFSQFAWSQNQRYLAFTSETRFEGSIFASSSLSVWDTESRETKVLSEIGRIFNVLWSPNSQSIVVGVLYEEQGELVRFDLSTNESTVLLDVPALTELKPLTWSPDGQWVLFYSENNNESSLNIIHRNGSAIYQLVDTTNSYKPHAAFWLAD